MNHLQPVLETWVIPYIPQSIPELVVKSSLASSFGGHVISVFAGENVGFSSSLALAYAGSEYMNSETTKTMLVTAGMQLLPSIIKRVASDVISSAIIGTGKVGVQAGIFLVTLPIKAIGSAWNATPEKDEKLAKRKQKIEKLKAEKLKLLNELNELKNPKKSADTPQKEPVQD